jgi:hypothetical protein
MVGAACRLLGVAEGQGVPLSIVALLHLGVCARVCAHDQCEIKLVLSRKRRFLLTLVSCYQYFGFSGFLFRNNVYSGCLCAFFAYGCGFNALLAFHGFLFVKCK